MSRYISFITLLVVIIVAALLFYKVMAVFFVPLFLAALLVVVFRPIHVWVLDRCKGRKKQDRKKLAALLTTLAIMLVVLVPLAVLFTMAAFESQQVLRNVNKATLLNIISEAREKLNLKQPEIAKELKAVEVRLENISQTEQLEEVSYLGRHLENTGLYNDELSDKVADQLESSASVAETWDAYETAFEDLRAIQKRIAGTPDDGETDTRDSADDLAAVQLFDFQHVLNEVIDRFAAFKVQVLGGSPFTVWLREMANPTPEVLEQYGSAAIGFVRSALLDLGATTTSFLGRLLLGAAIMIISLYFFLLDGPAMLETFKRLSPIEDEHEQELIVEFGRISRAVVVATLLAALVQALLGGIGYWFAGLNSIFLLTLLTGCLALVPFVGAAAVWVPCALWLYFIDNNATAAIGLAVYGVLVISMSDNLIKPLVLHGQSNLHPLLALLSVLGGVASLGPIGILIGPMIVVFLQTLLKILQSEMTTLDRDAKTAASSTAASSAASS